MYTPEGAIFAGTVYLDVFDTSGNLTGERDVGNTRTLTFPAPSITRKDKIGKRVENYGVKIESKIIQILGTVKFTLDDIFKENLALAMFGADSVVTVTGAAVTSEAVVAALGKSKKLAHEKISASPAPVVSAVTPSAWQATHGYVLGDIVLAGTLRGICTTAGTSGATEPTWTGNDVGDVIDDGDTLKWTLAKLAYVADTDYEIDETFGLLKCLSTGDIEDAQSLEVDYTYASYAGYKVLANQVQKIDCRLRFTGKNLNTDDNVMILVHHVSLVPSGDMSWITEDFGTLDFTGDIIATSDGTFEIRNLAA